MALKAILASLEGLSSDIAAEYIKAPEGQEGFVLDVDGKDLTAQVREFRGNNVGLEKRITEMEKSAKKFSGIDLEKYKAGEVLLQQIQDESERKLVGEGKWEEVYEMRTTKMRGAHENDMEAKTGIITGLEGTVGKLRKSLGKMKIEQSLGKALNTSGSKVRKSAMEDILSRTHGVFSVDDDGEIQALVGGQVARGPKGDPLTMLEHIDSLSKNAGHLFESGGGGGAGGSGDGGSTRSATGKIRVNRNNPLELTKFHKEIAADQVEFYDG